ncbi:hypothetical protein FSP39_010171 [Pinctada imbricata]|uniref:FYVE-type domain-containing protein n=1 Tax=Pinctada imbricata TaxID=66713 RepID=A0AA89BRP3_PINIB|nr:hypothetical protein FSP39_010171 [Pinctada imbricata]
MAAPEKKLDKSKSGLRMIPVNGNDSSPFTLSEPPWVPDDECPECQNSNCRARFDFIRRRKHHCRRCGKCFCNKCCEDKSPLPRMCFIDPVRQCLTCREISRRETDFFDKHLKILMNGGCFTVSDSDVSPEEGSSFFCKISPNHRQLLFEGECDKHEPVQIEKIDSLQILTSGKDDEGNTIAGGLAICYKDSTGSSNVVQMVVEQGTNKKPGQIWIAAMQKVSRQK